MVRPGLSNLLCNLFVLRSWTGRSEQGYMGLSKDFRKCLVQVNSSKCSENIPAELTGIGLGCLLAAERLKSSHSKKIM
jgi:hypothetical protein